MITKAVILSINGPKNRCTVRMPLFETAASDYQAKADACISIPPGLFNSISVGDVVYVAFEENELEKPVIIGKLFTNASNESAIRGGGGVFDTIKVNTQAYLPSSTVFDFPQELKQEYSELRTPKKIADYIKWLEKFTKKTFSEINDNFKCFKNWVQWQINPTNLEIDDGDLDSEDTTTDPRYCDGSACDICSNKCTKGKVRKYPSPSLDINYPEL